MLIFPISYNHCDRSWKDVAVIVVLVPGSVHSNNIIIHPTWQKICLLVQYISIAIEFVLNIEDGDDDDEDDTAIIDNFEGNNIGRCGDCQYQS